MLTNVPEQVDISHNVKSDFKSPYLNSLSGNSASSVLLKIIFFCNMFRYKSKRVKTGSVHAFRIVFSGKLVYFYSLFQYIIRYGLLISWTGPCGVDD